MSHPAISVAMSVYNGEDYLAAAIESILAQSFDDFEFLILNDGSNDSSRAIIDDFAAKDGRIRAIHRENRGLIASLNQLIDEAKAPIIARMDGDDIALPERFERQFRFLADNPDYGVISSWTTDIDSQGIAYPLQGRDQPVTHEELLKAIDEGGALLCHPSAMYRRDLVQSVGGYHAAFRHCEDFDLWLRLANRTKLGSLPERLLKYRHTDGQVSNRHVVEQQLGVAAARLAHRERVAGRPDPTEHLDALPPLEEFDSLFGRVGAEAEARAITCAAVLYSEVALRGSGFDLVMRHIRDGNHVAGLRRTVLRLLRIGEPARAFAMASALLFG